MTQNEFFSHLPMNSYSQKDRELLFRAYWLANEAHLMQMRETGESFFEHPKRVALFLSKNGFHHPRIICSALLHDCVEESKFPIDIYITLCGSGVWTWVEALSKKIPVHDQKTGCLIRMCDKDTAEYYARIARMPTEVRLIKIADRIDNLSTSSHWEKDRLIRYIEDTKRYLIPIATETNSLFLLKLKRAIFEVEYRLHKKNETA